MPEALPQRKSAARLDPSVYCTSSHVFHIIACTRNRAPALGADAVAAVATRLLTETAAAWQSTVFCYCVMPDHIHALLTPGRVGTGDLRRIVGGWKAAMTRQCRAVGVPDSLWQRGFWDHLVRQEEDRRAICEYILANPVRKGLVARPEEWPFSWFSPEA